MTIDNKYEITQTVYLKTDLQQAPCIITQINIREKYILYEVAHGTTNS
jgi:hypothetical protein